MIETWLAQKAVRIAILVAALLCPFAVVGCTVETVKLHGIALPAPNFWPFHGSIELVHGAIADRDAAVRLRDAALRDRDRLRQNQVTLEGGLKACSASVARLGQQSKVWEDRANAAVAAADKARGALEASRARMNRIKSTDEVCPVVDQIFRAGLQ